MDKRLRGSTIEMHPTFAEVPLFPQGIMRSPKETKPMSTTDNTNTLIRVRTHYTHTKNPSYVPECDQDLSRSEAGGAP